MLVSGFLQFEADLGEECRQGGSNFWEELQCGIYSVSVDDSKLDGDMVGEVERHEWTDPMLYELINWERTSVQPKPEELNISRMKFRSCQHDMHSVISTTVPHELGKCYQLLYMKTTSRVGGS